MQKKQAAKSMEIVPHKDAYSNLKPTAWLAEVSDSNKEPNVKLGFDP